MIEFPKTNQITDPGGSEYTKHNRYQKISTYAYQIQTSYKEKNFKETEEEIFYLFIED